MKSLEHTVNTLDADALADLIAHLLTFVNPERVERIDRVLARRTRFLTVVLENVYRAHNASAAVRSCECFGVQDLHAIEAPNSFEINRSIVQGAAKWITLHRYRGKGAADACLHHLKRSGYRIVAMSPEPEGIPIHELSLDDPVALCFGSEEPGLTRRTRSIADDFGSIPMQGFTQSLNLSVSVGAALQHLCPRLRASDDERWKLDVAELDRLRALWLAQSVRSGRSIVQRRLNNA